MANSLRDYALQQGLKLDYDPKSKNVGVNGTQYTPQQLQGMGGTLNNGAWQFQDAAQLRAFGGNPPSVAPTQQPQVATPQQAIPQVNTTPVPQVKTIEQLMSELVAAQQAQKANALNQAFETTRGRLTAEQQALAPQYEAQQRQLSAQDTMARANTQNQLAMQGLAGSGAQNQQDTSQNVISQGAMSNLGLQRASAESDIQRRLSEAQQARDFGIANSASEASLMGLEQQINRLGQQEGYARQDAQLADQRKYNEGLTNQELALKNQDASRQRELDTIGQYSNDYQAEINRRQATPDTADDWLIPYLKDVRGQKVSSIEQGKAKAEQENYNRMLEEQKLLVGQEKQIYDRAFQKYNAGIPVSAQEAQVLGVKPGAFKPKEVKASTGDKGLSDAQQWTRIKDKLDMGIPLTDAEKAVLGGEPTPPQVKGVDASAYKASFDRLITENTPKNELPNYKVILPRIADEIIKNVKNGLMSTTTAQELSIQYGIDQKMMQQAENRSTFNPGSLNIRP